VLEPFQQPFVQRGLVEILILAVPAGLLGTWIVLRGLAFHSHAVGTAAFPGLVLADGLGFAAPLGAFGAAGVFTAGTFLLGRGRRTSEDSATALVLVGCLAGGVILASDVFGSGANIDTLLFGSLLLIDGGDIALAAIAAGCAIAGTFLCGRHWLARGFDPESAPALGAASPLPDLALLGLIALATTAALTAVGALLVTALFVVPAATARLLTRRVPQLQLLAIAIAAAEGVLGLWLSVETDAPPGATIATLAGGGFAAALALRWVLRRPRALATAAALGALLAAAGCGGSDGDGELRVVATTTQVGDFVRAVGGSRLEDEQLLDPNTDPHEYEPRPSDVSAAADAELMFRSGGDLDDWTEEVISDSGSDATLVDLSHGIPVRLRGEAEGGGGEEFDAHWWHDPANAIAAVRTVRARLADADPAHARQYGANARTYIGELRRLDDGIRACVASVPPQRRKLVTDHDAFGYFARRYGIEVVGAVIPAITTQAQPSAGELADLADVVRREDVRAIFPESSVNNRLAEAIARETGASADYTLYGDTLGPEGSPGATYLGMEEANADAIVRGFTDGARGCDIGGSA
jgi:ABC-type Zn uptake system ZnuABC Zn-binding protein ZnuA/ABC-type Mn2+/Zn2+ transport system permease subunit